MTLKMSDIRLGDILIKARRYSDAVYCKYGGLEERFPLGSWGIVTDKKPPFTINMEQFTTKIIWSFDISELEKISLEETKMNTIKINDAVVVIKDYDGTQKGEVYHIINVSGNICEGTVEQSETKQVGQKYSLRTDNVLLLDRKHLIKYYTDELNELKTKIGKIEKIMPDLTRYSSDEEEIAEKVTELINKGVKTSELAEFLKKSNLINFINIKRFIIKEE